MSVIGLGLLTLTLLIAVLYYRRLASRGTASLIEDGDGFTLKRRWLPAVRVRIAWIDAPEKGQPYADAARGVLRSLLKGQALVVNFVDKDVYGRRVAQVWVGKEDVGLKLLEAGAAWYYRRYGSRVPFWRHWGYASAERRARSAKRGLWAKGKPEAPWDFKHRPWWRKLLG